MQKKEVCENSIHVINPKIGEAVYLDKYKNYKDKWWRDIE